MKEQNRNYPNRKHLSLFGLNPKDWQLKPQKKDSKELWLLKHKRDQSFSMLGRLEPEGQSFREIHLISI